MNPPIDAALSPEVLRDWQFACRHESSALTYLSNWIASRFLLPSDERRDLKEATDYTFSIPKTDWSVGARMRRVTSSKTRRDLTIRWSRPSGVKTEAAKIAEGHVNLYLYAWIDATGDLEEYMLVSVERMRAMGHHLHPQGIITNADKSSDFAFWSMDFLQDRDLILDGIKYPGKAVQFRIALNVPWKQRSTISETFPYSWRT